MNYLALTNTYETIDIALYRADHLITRLSLPKKQASKLLAQTIKDTLGVALLTLQDLSYIVVNQGPGPFTTLRVVIATVNGISFASKVPLLGIDGLDALLHEARILQRPVIALLNAFNHDVYFAIQDHKELIKGYRNITALLNEVLMRYPKASLSFIGNGAHINKEIIQTILGNHAQFPDAPEHCSVATIGELSLTQRKDKSAFVAQIKPLYLKQSTSS